MESSAKRIETRFRQTLAEIQSLGLTAKTLRDHPKLYLELAERTMDFFLKVVYKTSAAYRAFGSRRGRLEPDEIADTALVHLLHNLDAVLRAEQPVAYSVRLAMNALISAVRDDKRLWGEAREAEDSEARLTLLDELGWSLLPDSRQNIERDYETRAMASRALSALRGREIRPVYAVCFLAVHVLGWKTDALAQSLCSRGYRRTLCTLLRELADTTGSVRFWQPLAADAMANDYRFEDRKAAAAKISRCTFAAKQELQRLLTREYGGMTAG